MKDLGVVVHATYMTVWLQAEHRSVENTIVQMGKWHWSVYHVT